MKGGTWCSNMLIFGLQHNVYKTTFEEHNYLIIKKSWNGIVHTYFNSNYPHMMKVLNNTSIDK